MFKKFKDKLAEEMKQSPARLQASMQQLAQAVVSPALSNSSIQELSASNDNFSLTEEGDETPKNSPAKHGFQNVDLTSPSSNSVEISRRSSISSVASVDAASLFPIYENPGNMYHLQSDMEQSASEADENLSPQLDRVTKDQLYAAYRKVQTKYHKYRGRYTDLANHYREMERVKGKLEGLLVETQDKALRRIADLKEQCQLEQQAKAHLEDALRNDIEEKDHVIGTLNTKITFLQTTGPSSASSANPSNDSHKNHPVEQPFEIFPEKTSSPSELSKSETPNIVDDNAQLRTKLEKLEALITKYKDSLKRNKEKISEITQEKSIIERDFELFRNSTSETISNLEKNVKLGENEIATLREKITSMGKREEESAISLAENKLSIHRELEVKEAQIKELRRELKTAEGKLTIQRELEVKDEQIKELRKELKLSRENRETLEQTVERYKNEIENLRTTIDRTTDAEKTDLVRDLSKGKTEALRLMQKDMQRRISEIEKTTGVKLCDEETKNRDLTEKLERREEDLRCFEREIADLRRETENYREKCEHLRNELSSIKDKEYRNEIGNRTVETKKIETDEKIDEKKNLEIETEINPNDVDFPQQSNSNAKKFENVRSDVEGENNCGSAEAEKSIETMENRRDDDGKKSENNFPEKGAEDSKQAEYAEKEENRWITDREKLSNELSTMKSDFEAMKIERENLKIDSQKNDEILMGLKKIVDEKEETIVRLNSKIEIFTTAVEKSRARLEAQQTEIERLRENSDADNEISRLREDTENKNVEILGLTSEIKSCKSTINDLREKIRRDSEKIDLLTKEKICLISNVLDYKNTIGDLKKFCGDVREKIGSFARSGNEDFSKIREIVTIGLEKYSTLQTENNEREIVKFAGLREKLENELKERDEKIAIMREKIDRWDEINRKNKNLIGEIDNLNFRIFDLGKLKIELENAKLKIENLKSENLELKKNFEESTILKSDLENRTKTFDENSAKLRDLEISNEELKKINENYVESNSKMKIDYENEKKILEEKLTRLELEFAEFKSQSEEDKKIAEQRCSIEDMEIAKMKAEHENYEKLVADYAEKIKYFETECAKRDTGLEQLRLTMEKREKILEETVEKSKNYESRMSKISTEKSELETKFDNREKILKECEEKIEKLEFELSKLVDEKSKLTSELEKRDKIIENSEIIVKNLDSNYSKILDDKLKLENEVKNREKLLEISAEKLQSCEIELSKLFEEKSKFATELANREKSLKDVNEKLTILEDKLSKMSEEHCSRTNELEKRDELLREQMEKSKKMEMEFSQISEEKSKLRTELENREKLLTDTDEKLKNLENQLSKLIEEKSELSSELNSLKIANTDFEGSNEALKESLNSKNALVNKLKALKERQTQTIQNNETKIVELETKISQLEAEKSDNTELVAKISNFEIVEQSLRKEIRDAEENSSRIIEEKQNLEKINENLRREIAESSSLGEQFEKLKSSYEETKSLNDELERTNESSKKLKTEMEMRLESLEKNIADKTEEIVNLNNEIARRDEEFRRHGENSNRSLENFEELKKNLEKDFRDRAEKLENEYVEKIRNAELEIERSNDESKVKMQEKEDELQGKIIAYSQDNELRELVEQLQNQLRDKESKLANCQTKGSQIRILNEELRKQKDKLKEEIETIKSEHNMGLKQLVKEFQAQLCDKDEELQAALNKRFETQENYESELVHQYREQLKDFRVELVAKSECIESMMIENKEEIATKNREMEKLIETIGNIKQEHASELREIERKWKAVLKQKSEQLEAKHEEDVTELTREWQNERRELESTSRVAMAAVQSNTGSLHSLQQTLVSQRRELAELRKILKLRQDTLEDSTEIEYLRNILYEYMMGRETVVLARVIAAVVKFDQDQTTKILKKEEDKLTLLGSLGLS